MAYEKAIVWLEDITNLRFVREVRVNHRRRTGRVALRGTPGRVVGYAEVTTRAPRVYSDGWYSRRVFYLVDGDFEAYPEGRKPSEGVDPKTVVVEK